MGLRRRRVLNLTRFEIGGTITDGRVLPDDIPEMRRLATEMGDGLRVVITVEGEKEHRPKSDEQRRYWFAVPVALLAEHCGMSDRQSSHAMLGECFGYVDGPCGKPVPVEPSFADLTVDKASRAIDWALDWLPAEFEIICPPPDKNWRQHADTIRRQRRHSGAS